MSKLAQTHHQAEIFTKLKKIGAVLIMVVSMMVGTTACDYDQIGNEPIDCANPCDQEGQTQCIAGHVRDCQMNPAGCLTWSDFSPCPEGLCDDDQTCGGCDSTCPEAGATECLDDQIRTCEADENGCLDWSEPSVCPDGFCADNQTCGGCNNTCYTEGETTCSEGLVQTMPIRMLHTALLTSAILSSHVSILSFVQLCVRR